VYPDRPVNMIHVYCIIIIAIIGLSLLLILVVFLPDEYRVIYTDVFLSIFAIITKLLCKYVSCYGYVQYTVFILTSACHCWLYNDKKENRIFHGIGCKVICLTASSYMTKYLRTSLLRRLSYMTLHPIPSEFPYIRGKFSFLF
jgi:hypothetical protein